MKRFVKAILFITTVVLILSFTSTVCLADAGLDNFKKDAVYTPGRFVDVAANAWYANSVKEAYEYGLVKGTSDTTFNPNGDITIVESITLASRLNSIYYNGSANFVQGLPWYQAYVDYAESSGIIERGEYSNKYNEVATRAQFAMIFASALPAEALQKINNVETGSLPDVKGNETYGPAVYKLYNAGILTGNDDYGTFYPNSYIKRSEVAAIVTRMADTSLRKTVNIKPAPVPPTNIVLSESSITLYTGESKTLIATVLPDNATDKSVFWKFSNGSYYVDLSPDGTVTGRNKGIATITAVTSNGLEASCTIEVKSNSIAPTEAFSLKNGTDMPFISTWNNTRCKMTECWLTSTKMANGSIRVTVHISGEKIANNSVGDGSICRFNYKICDSEGYIVNLGGTGVIFVDKLSPGDKFKDITNSFYVDPASFKGEYTLTFYNN